MWFYVVLQSFANQFPSLEILDLSNNLIATVEEVVIVLFEKSQLIWICNLTIY